jgi:dihydroorotase
MARLTIINGRVIDPGNGLDQQTDLVLEAGRVVSVGKIAQPDTSKDSQVLDASGCIVCPGLIDVHVHLREPGQEEKETIATGAASAVAGGFTSVCCMPNTQPALDDDSRIEFVYRQAQRAGLANVFPVGAITKGRRGEELAEIAQMAASGAVGFSDDGVGVASAGVMAKALSYIAMTGRVLMQHCEDPQLGGGVMNAGTLATRLGLSGWPRVAEELMIQRDIMLNRAQGSKTRYHVQHLSSGGSVELVRRARADKAGQATITAEASPHHLLLTEEACATYDPNYKMNPPLRSKRDVEELIEGIKDGTITVLATDHAPHTLEEKQVEFTAAAYGILGLECALPLYKKALIDSGAIDWPKLIAMMTINGTELCGLTGKGKLSVGADADVTIIDPEQAWTIDVSRFASKSRNCPFDGWNVTGRAIATIVGGNIKLALDPERIKGGNEPACDSPQDLLKPVAV